MNVSANPWVGNDTCCILLSIADSPCGWREGAYVHLADVTGVYEHGRSPSQVQRLTNNFQPETSETNFVTVAFERSASYRLQLAGESQL